MATWAIVSWAAPPTLLAAPLQFSIGHVDITPDLAQNKAVWLAGYYHGRAATDIHDRLNARGILLSDGQQSVAIVSLDLIGWSLPSTLRIRQQLPEVDYVMVCSTHSHEGPDTIGLWGESVIKSGVDDAYNHRVERAVVTLVKQLSTTLKPVTAQFGTIDRPELVHDSRLPIVIDSTIRVIQFRSLVDNTPVGQLVQGTAHPEALGSKNTQITADFPYYTQKRLEQEYACPTVYVSGAIGGLLAPPQDGIVDQSNQPVHPGNFEYAEAYGNAVGQAVIDAVQASRPIPLTPIVIQREEVAIPIDNPLYRIARSLNVIRRDSYEWTGNSKSWGKPITRQFRPERGAIVSEVAVVSLGPLRLLGIPGELYPELVTGDVPNPPMPHVDYPEAPIEPIVRDLLGNHPWMLMGLANDEIGYIIPKRQWDRDPPFAYGRSMSQYGEINSCSPEVGPIIMQTLAELCERSEITNGN
ncbi:hypothetical protein DTL42_03540 [Bremerella cremea]|uniref:Neutral/alkaline non-lysosomal ceramidase N-terminal domain-containing protein n=2 Tax=Bremerella cremea TaxID=1031537 RepID=A0A368KUY1_9BACT|nr:hypothetical protein DTL42_03540 [Bremerella cremea]